MTAVFSGEILIVEDNVIIAMDVEELALDLGAASAHLVSNAADALSYLETASPNAAILDFNVEGGTTESVADRLREKGVRFVFATGYADTSMLPERFQACRMLKKPFGAEDIVVAFAEMPDP